MCSRFDCAIMPSPSIIALTGRIPLLLSSRTTVQEGACTDMPFALHAPSISRSRAVHARFHHGRWSPLASTGTDSRLAPHLLLRGWEQVSGSCGFLRSRRLPSFVKLSLVKHESLAWVCCVLSFVACCPLQVQNGLFQRRRDVPVARRFLPLA